MTRIVRSVVLCLFFLAAVAEAVTYTPTPLARGERAVHIARYAACDGTTNDTTALGTALTAASGGTLIVDAGCRVLLGTPGDGNATATLASGTKILCEDTSSRFVLARHRCSGGTFPTAFPGAACTADAECGSGGTCGYDIASSEYAPSGQTVTIFKAATGATDVAVIGCGFEIRGIEPYFRCTGGTSANKPCYQTCSSGTFINFPCNATATCSALSSGTCQNLSQCADGGGDCTSASTAPGKPSGAGNVLPIDFSAATSGRIEDNIIYDQRQGDYTIKAGLDVRVVRNDNTRTANATPIYQNQAANAVPTVDKGVVLTADRGTASNNVLRATTYGVQVSGGSYHTVTENFILGNQVSCAPSPTGAAGFVPSNAALCGTVNGVVVNGVAAVERNTIYANGSSGVCLTSAGGRNVIHGNHCPGTQGKAVLSTGATDRITNNDAAAVSVAGIDLGGTGGAGTNTGVIDNDITCTAAVGAAGVIVRSTQNRVLANMISGCWNCIAGDGLSSTNINFSSNRCLFGAGAKVLMNGGAGWKITDNYLAWGTGTGGVCRGGTAPGVVCSTKTCTGTPFVGGCAATSMAGNCPCTVNGDCSSGTCSGGDSLCTGGGVCEPDAVIQLGSETYPSNSSNHPQVIANLIHSNMGGLVDLIRFGASGKRCQNTTIQTGSCTATAGTSARGTGCPCTAANDCTGGSSTCTATNSSNGAIVGNKFYVTAARSGIDLSTIADANTTVAAWGVSANDFVGVTNAVKMSTQAGSATDFNIIGNSMGTAISKFVNWSWAFGTQQINAPLTDADDSINPTFLINRDASLAAGDFVETDTANAHSYKRATANSTKAIGVALDAPGVGSVGKVNLAGQMVDTPKCNVDSGESLVAGDRIKIGPNAGKGKKATDADNAYAVAIGTQSGTTVDCILGAPTSQPGVGMIFTNTADSSAIANTTTDTAFLPTGIGSLTLPANYLIVGKSIRVKAFGKVSTKNTSGTVFHIGVKIGSGGSEVVIMTTPDVTLTFGMNGANADRRWTFDGQFTVRTIGSGTSATAMGAGYFSYPNTTAAVDSIFVPTTVATLNGFNSTAAQQLTVWAKWTTADTNNSITLQGLTLEALN